MKIRIVMILYCLINAGIVYCQPFKESFDNGSVTGVNGKAKLFDGYFTEHMVAANKVPSSNSFTIEAWIAMQEYAYTVAAIADKENDFKSGYLFGIDQQGKLSGSVAVNGEWITCVSTEAVPLLQWVHVAMVVENAKEISLFLNGKNAGNAPLPGNSALCDTCLLSIGKTQTKTSTANTERKTSVMLIVN